MSVSKYAYTSAKIGAMKSYLLSSGELKSLIEAPTLSDAFSLLKDTEAYGRELSKLTSATLLDILADIENVLVRSFTRDHEKIERSVKGNERIFLKQVAKKFETNALKTIIMMKTAKSSEKEMKEYLWIPYGRIDSATIEKLLQAGSIEELIEMLSKTEYHSPLVGALQNYKEMARVFPFTVALDNYVYTKIIQSLDLLRRRDRSIAKGLIGIEIDAKNFMVALRLRGDDEEAIWDYLIPYRYNLNDEMLMDIIRIKHLGQLATELPQNKYTGIISKAVKEYQKSESLLPFELAFKEYMLQLSKRMFYGDRFNIGVPMAYLNLKENEIRNLVAILKIKGEGISPSEIPNIVMV